MENKIIGQIHLNYRLRFEVDDMELTSGDPLEVLVLDKTGYPVWVSTRVEYNEESGYYLVGLLGCRPVGLFARV